MEIHYSELVHIISKAVFCSWIIFSGVSAAPTLVKYSCTNKARVQVTYNGDSARLVFNNKIYLMKSAISASGARYIGGGYTWWTKANEGSLFRGTNLETMQSIARCKEK
jgi:membrane-bound inhibitor of C-type lysozyme